MLGPLRFDSAEAREAATERVWSAGPPATTIRLPWLGRDERGLPACRPPRLRPARDGGLGLSRITAYAAADNLASRHVIESVGFRQCGVERRGVRNNEGVVSDQACHDLLVEDFSSR